MSIADLLIDSSAYNEVMTFVDGNTGYNHIFIAKENVPKTTFRCPRSIEIYQWKVMPFGLKNARATYLRAMNYKFHYSIGDFVELYIDDIIVKSSIFEIHLVHLRKMFERMCQH